MTSELHYVSIPYGKNEFKPGDIVKERYDGYKQKVYKIEKVDKRYAYAEGVDFDKNKINRKFKLVFEKLMVSTGTDTYWRIVEVPFVKWQDSSKYTVERKEEIEKT